jgi:hypothetical protein
MTEVIVEHHNEPPLTDAEVNGIIAGTADCFGMHRVDRNCTLLSMDGREMFCHFTALDLESVRIALRQVSSPRCLVWSGTVHDAADVTAKELAEANVLVSRTFDAAVGLEEIQALDNAGSFAAHRARRLRTFLSTDRRRMVCLYQASDAESVSAALREAGIAVERVWAFRGFMA